MEKQYKIARWVLAAACVMILFLLAMVCLDIHLDGAGFSRESIAERLSIVAPMLVLSLAVGVVSALVAFRGGKDAKVGADGKKLYKAPKDKSEGRKIRGMMLVLALLLIALGAVNGGARDVFVKAANICTECIGLG